MKTKIIFLFIALTFLQNSFGQFKKYHKKQIIEDLEYLYPTLEAAHNNLYANTDKDIYQDAYDSILNAIPRSMSVLETYLLFQSFVAHSGQSHCNVQLPFDALKLKIILGRFFPLDVIIKDDKVFIKNNYSKNIEIKTGDELVSIDKTPIINIINELNNYISGETNYYKKSYIEKTSLPLMLWLTLKHKHSYSVEINDKKGITQNLEINAIRGIKYFNRRQQSDPFKRKLNFFDSIAYLTPGSFYNPSKELLSKSTFDTRSYLQFLENSFTKIKNRKSENLIIDLRNNEGGMSLFSMPLVSYFADTSFMSNMNVTYKTSQITKNGLQVLPDSILSGDDILLKNNLMSHQNGELFDMTSKEQYHPVDDSIQFKGNVYVLINKYTNSEAIVISSLIQDYKFAVLVGEITPNTATQYASIQQFELPNTKLKVAYPRAYLERKKGEASLLGVLPDYLVTQNSFTDKDEILDFTLNLIRNGDK